MSYLIDSILYTSAIKNTDRLLYFEEMQPVVNKYIQKHISK